MVRMAREADIPKIIDMVFRLSQEIAGPQTPCRIKTGQTLAGLIHSPDGAVWVSEGGFIAGCLTRTVISDDLIATELGWLATDRSGLKLLRSFECWARERGATLIKLSANGGAAARILERSGYRACETAWVK